MRNQSEINDSAVKNREMKFNSGLSFLKLKMRILSVLVLAFVFSLSLRAQDFKRQYRQAKDLFAAGNYSAALDAFSPLTVYDKNNPFPEYANFYYALSAQRLGFVTLAKQSFLETKKLYPQWDQLDEVNYWLVRIYLDQREYFHAWQLAREIKNPSFRTELDALKRTALSKVDDTETLKMLWEENPQDVEIAFALAKAIGRQSPMVDAVLLDSLATLYRWDKSDFIRTGVNAPVFKDKYRIALLMPFRTSTLDAGPGKKKSQYALDLYEGMKLAADSLSLEGISVDLLAYDTDHDLEVVKKLVKEEELKSADLLIGPLFPEEAAPVHEFSQTNKINLVINPLSFNIDLLAKNPYAFLFQPSYATVGEKSAEMLAKQVPNKNCMVFFGENTKDSVMAASFRRAAAKSGLRIVHMERVSGETSGTILTTLATATRYDEWKNPKQFKLKLDSLGSIFVASDDPLIYTKVINSVETRGDSIMVVGQENWLEDNSVDLSKFEKIKVAFAAPNFSSVSDKPYRSFRKRFLQSHGVLPSSYAQKGFEFMMLVGHLLNKYGVYFQSGIAVERMPGVLGAGYQMRPTRDNGIVPFVSFKGGRLEAISQP
jgi:tetratricopeptide (TPR) repeat protein